MDYEELKMTRNFLRTQFRRQQAQFNRAGLRPEVLKTAEQDLENVTHYMVQDEFYQRLEMQQETRAYYNFFYTRVPGALSDSRTVTSTVTGYRNVIRQTGQTLGIQGYSQWTEEQRSDLWDLIDRVREIGADRFLPNGYGSYLYQSGTSFRNISIIITELGIDDPVEILRRLDERIQAVEQGNTMTDREFFGV